MQCSLAIRSRAVFGRAALLLVCLLGLASTGCHFALIDDCGPSYRSAPRCGPPVFFVHRRHCR